MFLWHGIGITLYGKAKVLELEGEERDIAIEEGYFPQSYQAVKWFVILYMPILPMGTYRVLKVKQEFFTTEHPKYWMTPVPMDWLQVLSHYLVVVLLFGLLFVGGIGLGLMLAG